MDPLQQAREEIDRIDARMAELFEQRMEAVAVIAARKEALGLPVLDETREREVLCRNLDRIRNPALRPAFAQVLQALMSVSRAWQTEHRR